MNTFEDIVGQENLLLLGKKFTVFSEDIPQETARISKELSDVLGQNSMRYIGGGTRAFLVESTGKYKDLRVWLHHYSEISMDDVLSMQRDIESVTIKLKMLGAIDRKVVAPDLLRFKDYNGLFHYVRVSEIDIRLLWKCNTLSEAVDMCKATIGKNFMRYVDEYILPDGKVFMESKRDSSDCLHRYWLDYPEVVSAWLHWNSAWELG